MLCICLIITFVMNQGCSVPKGKGRKKGRQENVKKVLQMFDISLKPVCQIAQLLLILVVVSKVSSSEIHKYKQDKFHITFVLSLKQTSTIFLNVVF